MIYCLQNQKGEEWQYDWENSIDFGRAFCGGSDVVGGRGWLAALEVDKLSDAPWSRGDRKRVCGGRMKRHADGRAGFFPLFGVLFILVGAVQAMYNFKMQGSKICPCIFGRWRLGLSTIRTGPKAECLRAASRFSLSAQGWWLRCPYRRSADDSHRTQPRWCCRSGQWSAGQRGR